MALRARSHCHHRLHRHAHLREHLRHVAHCRSHPARSGRPRPGLGSLRPLHHRAHPSERGRPSLLEAPGLRHLQDRDQRQLQPRAPLLRHALQPVHDLPHQPLRRLARQPNHEIHDLVFAARGNHAALAAAHRYRHCLHHRHPRAHCALIRGGPHGHARDLHRCGLYHVPQDHPALRCGCRRAKPLVRRTFRLCYEHPRRENLRPRRLRALPLHRCLPRSHARRFPQHARYHQARHHDLVAHRGHHVHRLDFHRGRQRVVRHQRRHARDDVHLYLQPHHALQHDQFHARAPEQGSSATPPK